MHTLQLRTGLFWCSTALEVASTNPTLSRSTHVLQPHTRPAHPTRTRGATRLRPPTEARALGTPRHLVHSYYCSSQYSL
eukprot:4784170-Pleurochrysis_carterae.AAC.3